MNPGVKNHAKHEISKFSHKYYLSERDAKPSIYANLTSNWLELHVRYVVGARDRRATAHRLSSIIIEKIQEHDDIAAGSQTPDIIGFPDKHDSVL